jgi:hypothetical protein
MMAYCTAWPAINPSLSLSLDYVGDDQTKVKHKTGFVWNVILKIIP